MNEEEVLEAMNKIIAYFYRRQDTRYNMGEDPISCREAIVMMSSLQDFAAT